MIVQVSRKFAVESIFFNLLSTLTLSLYFYKMSNKTRSFLKAIAVILVLVAVLIQLDYISIRYVDAHRFWLTVTGFGLLLIGSR